MCRSKGGLGVRTKRNYDMCSNGRLGSAWCPMVLLHYAVCMGKARSPLNSFQVPFNDPNQPVPLDVVLTNRQFILPRCDTLTFTAASLRLLTTSKCSCFFDNRLTPPSRYKRECSNKLVLLNMDCGFFYFDELVTYYAVSCLASL